MTDVDIARALELLTEVEQKARACYAERKAAQDLAESDCALVVVRQAVALRGPLERWTVARAQRRALRTS